MNKKIIITIAVALAIILIGAVVVFAIHNSNDNVRDDEIVKDNFNKESISSVTDDTESEETERNEVETEKTSDETTQPEKENNPPDKEPEETKTPTKNPAGTKTPTKNPVETQKPSNNSEDTKPEDTKPEDTKPEDTKPEDTKPEDTKPTNPDRNEFGGLDFTIYDGKGNKVHLSDFAGKKIILNFWASWCVPCKKEMPDFNKKYLEYGDEIQFLMIDFAKDDKIEDAKKYVSDMGFEFPVYFDIDGDAFLTYEVSAFPTTIFIDAKGNVVERYRGTISEETLQSGIDKLLK